MTRLAFVLLLTPALASSLSAQNPEPEVTFRSDISLVRVDAQVLTRDNRAVTGLRAEDFVIIDEGKRQKVRSFASEEMPVDVLFLLDVSGSMRTHVQRLASAAGQALQVLGKDDRVAIMVFDRSTRVRSPFRSSQSTVEQEFNSVLRHESFNGGTDITRALIDAADYIRRQARREARRAIVILTDDQTEYERDDERVSLALQRADAVLSALLAPDAMQYQTRRSGGGYPGGGFPGGGYPGRRPGYGGGRMPMPMPIPIPMPGGGSRVPAPGYGGSRTHSAGTAEIAERSGGDSLPVDDSSALETTLARIRQRYALFYNLPAGARAGQERTVRLELADAARRRYPDADIRFRRVYMTPDNIPATSLETPSEEAPEVTETAVVKPSPAPPTPKRRPNVADESTGTRGPLPSTSGGWRRIDPPN